MHFLRRPQRHDIKRVPDKESVWDYPRPPRLEVVPDRIRIVFSGVTVADSVAAYRVLETSHPPNYYLPPGDVLDGTLARTLGTSFCEWKGEAHYFDVTAGGQTIRGGAWGYDRPTADFAPIAGHVAFYCAPMDACFVGDEVAVPQPGGFYGGWITSGVTGPFKGEPGTNGW
jgi:uncharacterized protein (DUF427 family)